ncbi:hypothetical protein Y032_0030g2061 [Ancylostoma ceylanicum]|uniref:Reverse transcriptase domain-containing protein n=1 Tax=Ancylostoma ceylanicum TaxID=53326 RepID=A0A016UPY0_9BILA|nr:hypothetical protein Y032_0030g2061 [Ancylostoma ceylanicum]
MGVEFDHSVEIKDNIQIQQVIDASGQSMNFLGVIAALVKVEGAGEAKVQMHVQKTADCTLLLERNALEFLGIKITFSPQNGKQKNEDDNNHTQRYPALATATERVLIPPKGIATITVNGSRNNKDQIFWSNSERIASGVCKIVNNVAEIRVANPENKPWVIQKGKALGEWEEGKWYDPDTADLPGDMLAIARPEPTSQQERVDKLIDLLIKNRCENELGNEVIVLIQEYQNVFALTDVELTQTHMIEHDVEVGNHEPIRQKTRPVPLRLRGQVNEMLMDLKKRNIIEESTSPWASPIVLVAKKDGSLRLCVDYREVNKVTKKDSYPIPSIDVILQNLKGKKWFSPLDLASGYWQIPLTKRAKEISAFTTTSGLYQFRVLPFGLTAAPAVFQRFMEKVLGELIGPEVAVYIDDIIIATETLERHTEVLGAVLDAFQRANLKIKPQKCRLVEPAIQFLGHIVDKDGVRTDPEKIEKIKNYPRPSNLAQLRTFLGMAEYYQKFVLRFAEIAKPLYALGSHYTPRGV